MSPTKPPVSDGLLDVTAVLTRAAERLSARFTGVFSAETVERYVFESYTALHRTARVKQHPPALTDHFATERQTALAQAKGMLTKPVPEVLFVCVQNAGRSQMAAAMLAHHGRGRVHVRSAGSHPSELDTEVVTVLGELGLDLAAAYPRPLTDDVVRAADVESPWAAATPVPSSPANAIWTGTSPTPTARPSRRSAPSATPSRNA
jgi:arsenate reductase